jgi:hypothetical protein
MTRRTSMIFLLVVALGLAAPQVVALRPAQAAVTKGDENDAALLNCDTEKFDAEMQRAERIGAKWVRIMVQDTRWPKQTGCIELAAKILHDTYHKYVLVTLVAWWTHPTVAAWVHYANLVVPRLARYADAWSVMNEPNHPSFRPATARECTDKAGQLTSWAYTVVQKINNRHHRKWRYKRVKPGRGKYGRKWHPGKHGRRGHWMYIRAHGKARKRARWIRIRVRSHTHRVTISGTSRGKAIRLCRVEDTGLAYRRIWDATAPIIRRYSQAPLGVGDQAPSRFNEQFMDAFYEEGPLPPLIRPQMLLVHPYDRSDPHYPQPGPVWNISGIYGAAAYAKKHGLALWASEWAYWPYNPAGWWPIAMSRMKAAGVKVIIVYDSRGPTWNTFMTPAALLIVGGWKG